MIQYMYSLHPVGSTIHASYNAHGTSPAVFRCRASDLSGVRRDTERCSLSPGAGRRPRPSVNPKAARRN